MANTQKFLNNPPFLFFIGNSGAGKDTSMDIVSALMSERGIDCLNIKRYVTRMGHESEDYHSVSETRFKDMIDRGLFAFYWKVYDTYYGYLKEDIDFVIENEIVALFNISRSLISVVRAKYPWCELINIKAQVSVSKERVKNRKREDEYQKQIRIKRMSKEFEFPEDTITVHNDGDLEKLRNQLEQIVDVISLNVIR